MFFHCQIVQRAKDHKPNKVGEHLIVRLFNVSEFSKAFPNVDVHKNSMGTLLYYPKSLEK